MFDLLAQTVQISLIVQLITGILGVYGITLPLKDEDAILTEVLIMETVVQIVEFIFYIWLAIGLYSYKTDTKSTFPLFDVTKRRYIDWFITTPTMLLSTIIFLKYLEFKENKSKEGFESGGIKFGEFVSEHRKLILLLVLSNAMMLYFGYMVESGKMDKTLGISLGFVFLIITFGYMYKEFAIKSSLGNKLFKFMFVIWALYGIAAIFSFYYKNITYNFLDIFAKNFFGLLLAYIIYKIYNKNEDIVQNIINVNNKK